MSIYARLSVTAQISKSTQMGTPSTTPLGVENVKIRENSEKNQGTSGGPLG